MHTVLGLSAQCDQDQGVPTLVTSSLYLVGELDKSRCHSAGDGLSGQCVLTTQL